MTWVVDTWTSGIFTRSASWVILIGICFRVNQIALHSLMKFFKTSWGVLEASRMRRKNYDIARLSQPSTNTHLRSFLYVISQLASETLPFRRRFSARLPCIESQLCSEKISCDLHKKSFLVSCAVRSDKQRARARTRSNEKSFSWAAARNLVRKFLIKTRDFCLRVF